MVPVLLAWRHRPPRSPAPGHQRCRASAAEFRLPGGSGRRCCSPMLAGRRLILGEEDDRHPGGRWSRGAPRPGAGAPGRPQYRGQLEASRPDAGGRAGGGGLAARLRGRRRARSAIKKAFTGVCHNRCVRKLSMSAFLHVAAALTAAAAVVMPPTAPAAHAADCNDVEVVFARGTSEDPGIGRVGDAFVDDLRGLLGNRSLGVYAVNYPAGYDFLAVATDGANDGSGHVSGWPTSLAPTPRSCSASIRGGRGHRRRRLLSRFPGIGFHQPFPPPAAPQPHRRGGRFRRPDAKIGLPLTSSPVVGNRGHRRMQPQRSDLLKRQRRCGPSRLGPNGRRQPGRRIRSENML